MCSSVPLLTPDSQSISPLTPLTCDRLCTLWRSVRDALQLWAQHGRGAGSFHLPLPPLPILRCCPSPKADLCASHQWVLLSPGSQLSLASGQFRSPSPHRNGGITETEVRSLFVHSSLWVSSDQVCTPSPGHCRCKGRALLGSLLPGLRAVRSLGPSGLGAQGFTAANPGAHHHPLCVITLCLHLRNLPPCK